MSKTTTLTTRLRELMEEATPGPIHPGGDIRTVDGWRVNLWSEPKKTGDLSGDMVAQLLTKADAAFHEALVNNAPTIIRLLEAGESAEKALDIAQEALSEIATGAFLGASTAAVAGPAAFAAKLQSLAEAVLATLRAAREGAR